jgi:RNA-directed DNA polymerase
VKFPDRFLEETWVALDFKAISEKLFRVQTRITQLSIDEKIEERIALQEELIRDIDFRCLAVKHVTDTSKSPGVDNVMWRTSAEKMQAAYDLVVDTFKASPLRIWEAMQKNNGKVRRYAIPTFHDRAMCVLMGYSLLPVTEVYADKKSFATRKGRSRYDAQAYVMEALKGANAPRYVVTTDVRSFYATVSHGWLMKHIPMNKKVLYELLHANIVESGEMFSRNGAGISEGCNLSPYIANAVLDGLQAHIYRGLYGEEYYEQPDTDYANGNMVRFADDIFVSVRSPEWGIRVLDLIDQFVKERGLQLKKEKTSIVCIEDGFDYLKFHFVRKNGVVSSYPSDASVRRIKADILATVETAVNQRKLIEAVNRKLRSWGNTYKFCGSTDVFEDVDAYVHHAILESVMQRYPDQTAQRLYETYWYTDAFGRRYFALPKQREVRVMHLADIIHVTYHPVKVTVNPFLDADYLKEREEGSESWNVTERYRPVWERQNGKCYYCGQDILADQPFKLITINPTRPDKLDNKAYIHIICEQDEYMSFYTLEDLDGLSVREVDNMLVYASADKRQKHLLAGNWKYRKLQDYFEKCRKPRITLTFSEIEKLSGYEISEARKHDRKSWRSRVRYNSLPDAWEAEGYRIDELDLEKEKITLVKRISGRAKLEIPEVLLVSEIPVHVKEEIEHYLKDIIKKRGIKPNGKFS